MTVESKVLTLSEGYSTCEDLICKTRKAYSGESSRISNSKLAGKIIDSKVIVKVQYVMLTATGKKTCKMTAKS